jgi:hypothetical protein
MLKFFHLFYFEKQIRCKYNLFIIIPSFIQKKLLFEHEKVDLSENSCSVFLSQLVNSLVK